MKKLKKRCVCVITTLLLVFTMLLNDSLSVQAAPIPAEGINSILGDATYVNQQWMNYRFYISGYGINCSLGIGEMKDYPVYIHTVNNITICELKKTKLIEAFMANINNDLSQIKTPVNTTVFAKGTSSVTLAGRSYYQLNADARNWILGVLQQALMETPGDIHLNLEDQFVAKAYETDTVALSPDYILSGTCTTSYKTSGSSRSNNIEVASSRLNNLVIMPGQSISVSDIILPRTTENGYQTAHAYLNGQIVDAVGGGICQVSSTVYNAARNSGMLITERHAHSMPVSYLPLGMDAAISSGTKDMVFQNPYSMPVIVQTSVTNKQLTVSFLISSDVLNGTTYKFWAKKTSSLSATSYLTTYVNGVETSTTVVDSSKYQALPESQE